MLPPCSAPWPGWPYSEVAPGWRSPPPLRTSPNTFTGAPPAAGLLFSKRGPARTPTVPWPPNACPGRGSPRSPQPRLSHRWRNQTLRRFAAAAAPSRHHCQLQIVCKSHPAGPDQCPQWGWHWWHRSLPASAPALDLAPMPGARSDAGGSVSLPGWEATGKVVPKERRLWGCCCWPPGAGGGTHPAQDFPAHRPSAGTAGRALAHNKALPKRWKKQAAGREKPATGASLCPPPPGKSRGPEVPSWGKKPPDRGCFLLLLSPPSPFSPQNPEDAQREPGGTQIGNKTLREWGGGGVEIPERFQLSRGGMTLAGSSQQWGHGGGTPGICRGQRGVRWGPGARGEGERRDWDGGGGTVTLQTRVPGCGGRGEQPVALPTARQPWGEVGGGAGASPPPAAWGVQAAAQVEPRCGAEAPKPPCKPGRASGHQNTRLLPPSSSSSLHGTGNGPLAHSH